MKDSDDGRPDDSPPPPGEVTQLLRDWQEGRDQAFEDLLPLVYDELRRVARSAMRGESEGHTLQTTALVHEAYLRLVGSDVSYAGSGHFMRVAARAMRRILVDHARKRSRKKRGAGDTPVSLDTLQEILPADSQPDDVIELDEALGRLSALEERKGQVVELHYFGGLSYDEVAEVLEISPATVHRDLRMARAWLYKELRAEG